jgi:hypothetical protein
MGTGEAMIIAMHLSSFSFLLGLKFARSNFAHSERVIFAQFN